MGSLVAGVRQELPRIVTAFLNGEHWRPSNGVEPQVKTDVINGVTSRSGGRYKYEETGKYNA